MTQVHDCKYKTKGKEKVVQELEDKLFSYDMSHLLSIQKEPATAPLSAVLSEEKNTEHCTWVSKNVPLL